MAIGFDTGNDTAMRLDKTLALYKGKPVFVTCGGETRNTVTVTPLGVRKRGTLVDVTSDDFQYTGLELGYINFEGSALYLAREPQRRQRAGISLNTISSPNLYIADVFNSKSMSKCIMGEHPSFREAVEWVEEGEKYSVAFHRHMAVRLNNNLIELLHRDQMVGYKTLGMTSFSLYETPEASYLVNIINNYNVEGLEV